MSLPASTKQIIQRAKAKPRRKLTPFEELVVKIQDEVKGLKKELTHWDAFCILRKYVTTAYIGNGYAAPLYVYNRFTGLYEPAAPQNSLLKRLILKVKPTLTIKQRAEIYSIFEIESTNKELTTTVKDHESGAEAEAIAVNNGIILRSEKGLQFRPFSPEFVFITKAATNYNAEAEEPNLNGWKLSSWFKELSGGDKNKEKLFYDLAFCAISSRKPEQAVFIVDEGQGRTGKSTFEQLLKNLVGIEQVAAINLTEFETRFSLATAVGKKLIIGDDNDPNAYLKNAQSFKSVVTGELVSIEQKGKDAYTAQLNALIIQTMNGLPRFKDKSGGLVRRIKLVSFNHRYPATAANEAVKDDYIKRPAVLEWLLNESLKRGSSRLPVTQEDKELLNQFKEENNPVAAFCSLCLPKLTGEVVPIKLLFYWFDAVQITSRNAKMTQRVFTKLLKQELQQYGWQYKPSFRANKTNKHDLQLINVALDEAKESTKTITPQTTNGDEVEIKLKAKQPCIIRA